MSWMADIYGRPLLDRKEVHGSGTRNSDWVERREGGETVTGLGKKI